MQDSGSNGRQLRERIIQVKDIRVEDRGGYDVLVVEDSVGNQYTTLRDEFVEQVPDDEEKYIGNNWKMLWNITKEGYINFHGFLERMYDEEPVEEEIVPENYEIVKRERLGLSDTDIRITRQSAGHGASRIVAGKLASGERLSNDEILEEMVHWTDRIKTYYRTGEWEQ